MPYPTEMVYNGQGQSLSLAVYQGHASLTSRYLLDGSQVLAATANGQTTAYLPGRLDLLSVRWG